MQSKINQLLCATRLLIRKVVLLFSLCYQYLAPKPQDKEFRWLLLLFWKQLKPTIFTNVFPFLPKRRIYIFQHLITGEISKIYYFAICSIRGFSRKEYTGTSGGCFLSILAQHLQIFFAGTSTPTSSPFTKGYGIVNYQMSNVNHPENTIQLTVMAAIFVLLKTLKLNYCCTIFLKANLLLLVEVSY